MDNALDKKISFGKPHKNPEYDGRERTGYPLQSITLREMLEMCDKMSINSLGKHHDGLVFPYLKDTLGEASEPYWKDIHYDGIAFVDFDNLSVDVCDVIYNSFDQLASTLPNLIAIQYSSSYFTGIKEGKGGLHCYVSIQPGDGYDYYNNSRLATAFLCWVINKVTGINLIEYGKNVIDHNNLKIGQRFFLFHSPYKCCEFAAPLTGFEDSKGVIDQFNRNGYDSLLGKLKNEKEFEDASPVEVDVFGKVSDKIQLEYGLECCIANTLHFIGWDDSKILSTLGAIDSRSKADYPKRHGQSWEEHMKQIIRTSHNQRVSKGQYNKAVELLKRCGICIVEKVDTKPIQTEENIKEFIMDDDKYLSSYSNVIIEYIQKERVLALIAPPGAGKTTAVQELVKAFPKSVVTTPFKILNHLYRPLNVVMDRKDKIRMNEPNVLVVDQFMIHLRELQTADVIFIDECHTLFLDRTYRKAMIDILLQLSSLLGDGKKVVFISATPAAEIDQYNAFRLVFKRKDKCKKHFTIINTNNTFDRLMTDVKDNSFDRVLVFSDRDVRRIYGNCIAENIPATIYHSEWPENVRVLRETELLQSKVNLLSCIGVSGINFNNEDANMLVSVRYTKGETSLNEIIQAVNRLRKAKEIYVRIYTDNKYEAQNELEDLLMDAKIIKGINSAETDSEYWSYMADDSVQRALVEIRDWYRGQSLDFIYNSLKNDGYDITYNSIFSKKIYSNINQEKKLQSAIFKDYVRTGVIDEEDMQKHYIREWLPKLADIKSLLGEDSENLIDKLLLNKDRLVDRSLSKILWTIHIASLSDAQWVEEKSKRDQLLTTSPERVKQLKGVFKEDDKIREQYKGLAAVEVVERLSVGSEEAFDAHQAGRSKGGQVGGLKGRAVIVAKTGHRLQGRVFETIKDAMKVLRISKSSVYKWLDSNDLQYVV